MITAIKVQKRNPNRVSIELDGEYAFGLSRIVGAWLKVGDRLSEEKITSLQAQDSDEAALQKAIHLIGHRPRTEQEIRVKLSEKLFTTGQIEKTLARLRETGLVRDDEFARMWVENRNTSHPRSKRLIGYELRRKGISDELIENALKGSRSDTELALEAASHYARRLTGLDWIMFRKKLSAFLARKGFSYGTITPVVHSIWNQMNLNGIDPGNNEVIKNE